ncbi:RNA polymerase sigma factor [Pedobacter sp. R20-19]|uniref:RNA polymerase sigma factor n=1 Tax=Pedobacter sp. R20-19 TaxID=1270196 RepID=UPI0004937694|nr:RNA polymerase sigma-70 factor [Pedobacter sp. R20-19]
MNVVKASEAELVLKLKNGSQTAFARLYELHARRIYTFALKILKSPALAEDIVQEVFVKLWETAPKLEPKLPLQSYLFTIARNLSLNVIRKAARETTITEEIARYVLDQGNNGLAAAQYKQTKEFVSRAVQLLPPQRRRIYELCHGAGYSYKQAAEELGLKDTTINSQMVKAIRSIKKYLIRNGALLSLFF